MQKISLIAIFFFARTTLLAQTHPVAWQELSRVAVNSNNSLTRTEGTGAYNAGAAGQNMILPGQDGDLQLTYATGANYGIGLSRLNNSVNLVSIDHAMQIHKPKDDVEINTLLN